MKQLHMSQDSNVALITAVDDKVDGVINKMPSTTQTSYACVATKSSANQCSINSTQQVSSDSGCAPLMVHLPPMKNRSHPSVARNDKTDSASKVRSDQFASSSKKDLQKTDVKVKRRPDVTEDDADTQDYDGFQLPAYARRKIDRSSSHKVIRGVGTSSGPLKGGHSPSQYRDLFVYRVDKSVDASVLKEHVKENGFNIHSLKCVSHEEAKYKSFQLAVPLSEFSGLFDGKIWPEGICVRRFRPRQNAK